MGHSMFSTTAWIEVLVSVLAEVLLKGEWLIITVFKVRVYTGLAHANAPEVPGGLFFYLTNLYKYLSKNNSTFQNDFEES